MHSAAPNIGGVLFWTGHKSKKRVTKFDTKRNVIQRRKERWKKPY